MHPGCDPNGVARIYGAYRVGCAHPGAPPFPLNAVCRREPASGRRRLPPSLRGHLPRGGRLGMQPERRRRNLWDISRRVRTPGRAAVPGGYRRQQGTGIGTPTTPSVPAGTAPSGREARIDCRNDIGGIYGTYRVGCAHPGAPPFPMNAVCRRESARDAHSAPLAMKPGLTQSIPYAPSLPPRHHSASAGRCNTLRRPFGRC